MTHMAADDSRRELLKTIVDERDRLRISHQAQLSLRRATLPEDQARAMSADYAAMHGLRPATPVNRDWNGAGKIIKAACWCMAGSLAFALSVLWCVS